MSKLREVRFYKRVSQLELFKRTGVWPSKISAIENGLLEPSEREKRKLAKALKVAVAELFPKEEANSHPSAPARSLGAPAFSCSPKTED